MIATRALATSVLVTIPVWSGSGPRVLGRTAAERQVEFAAACGCTEAIALVGPGGGGDQAIALRHLAENLGLRFREVSGPHALARSGQPGERLLVLEPGLLPDPSAWPRGADSDRGIVLTLPADVGVEAGFERIDLARAWAGALVLPGALLPRLLALPEDIEASSALLRIALQAGLPEAELDDGVLVDASWSLPIGAEDARLTEEKWLARQIGAEPGESLSRRLAGAILRRTGGKLLERREARPVALGVAVALPIGAIALCRTNYDGAGFLVLALSAPLLELALGLGRLQQARRGAFLVKERLTPLRWLIDGAILTCGMIAIEGDWIERVFAPIVLLAAFHAGPGHAGTGHTGSGLPHAKWQSLRDRGLVAIMIAAGAFSYSTQSGVMVAAIGLLALNIVQSRKGGG